MVAYKAPPSRRRFVAVVGTTLLARRSQVHQANLAAHADPYSRVFDARVQAITAADASHKALAVVYRQLFREAMTLAYIDVLWIMGVGTACMLPLLLLLKKNTPGKVSRGH